VSHVPWTDSVCLWTGYAEDGVTGECTTGMSARASWLPVSLCLEVRGSSHFKMSELCVFAKYVSSF